ncbi:M23 family metallopeptidase [Isoptericola sp. NEAU-Y5]|uniref:M23 family metallopeptidase n=1 Tax=Isoptericola luteus TaxID=2879484 RepID=A0ABS7ZDY2_9MICO|nr:M23 family metallopeptidase [Isoptericola sp. NEAU-Y5]MCA5893243.1 M23 family metallopeptidase [Isoptericola sp. NEAU-Y5]
MRFPTTRPHRRHSTPHDAATAPGTVTASTMTPSTMTPSTMTPSTMTPSTMPPHRKAAGAALLILTLTCTLSGAAGAAGAAVPADTPSPAGPGWVRPVPGAVRSSFEPPAEAWSAGHRGVDLGARTAEPVRSPADGTVTFAGQVAGKPVVVVAHPDGLRSTFEPARGTLARGAEVRAGEVVAHVGGPGAGASHCGPAACLHWGVLHGETYLDPLLLLGDDAPIVLLPVAGS